MNPRYGPIVERLLALDNGYNLAWNAVKEIMDDDERRQFIEEFAEWQRREAPDDPDVQKDALSVARENLGYAAVQHSDAMALAWRAVGCEFRPSDF